MSAVQQALKELNSALGIVDRGALNANYPNLAVLCGARLAYLGTVGGLLA